MLRYERRTKKSHIHSGKNYMQFSSPVSLMDFPFFFFLNLSLINYKHLLQNSLDQFTVNKGQLKKY